MTAGARNVETVRRFLRLLEDGDVDAWIELWADDADHFYPYGQEMFPPHLVGKAAIHARWRDTPAMFARFTLPLRETWVDGDTVIARFDTDSVLARTRRRYANSYICIFRFDPDGRIREYWEYFDPILAGVAFGLATVTYGPA